jgi:Flp pilus assembly pilin Flp
LFLATLASPLFADQSTATAIERALIAAGICLAIMAAVDSLGLPQ